jgi:hypothetical protein
MAAAVTESVFVQVEGSGDPFTISASLLGRMKMQRDMEVIRKVLRAIQEKNDLELRRLQIEGLDEFTVAYHVSQLHQAGYIDGPPPKPGFAIVRDLTWAGHEFAGAILTDDSTWSKIKEAIGSEKLIGMPLKVVQELATKALTAWAMKKLGL